MKCSWMCDVPLFGPVRTRVYPLSVPAYKHCFGQTFGFSPPLMASLLSSKAEKYQCRMIRVRYSKPCWPTSSLSCRFSVAHRPTMERQRVELGLRSLNPWSLPRPGVAGSAMSRSDMRQRITTRRQQSADCCLRLGYTHTHRCKDTLRTSILWILTLAGGILTCKMIESLSRYTHTHHSRPSEPEAGTSAQEQPVPHPGHAPATQKRRQSKREAKTSKKWAFPKAASI